MERSVVGVKVLWQQLFPTLEQRKELVNKCTTLLIHGLQNGHGCVASSEAVKSELPLLNFNVACLCSLFVNEFFPLQSSRLFILSQLNVPETITPFPTFCFAAVTFLALLGVLPSSCHLPSSWSHPTDPSETIVHSSAPYLNYFHRITMQISA